MVPLIIESFTFIITILSVCKCYQFKNFQHNTFYFNSYIDEFHVDDIITKNQNHNILIHNENIKIEFISNISTFIINNKIKLNWNNDNEWNEISNIYYNPFIINSINDSNNTTRRLLNYDYTRWNPYDHTTEHHIDNGRFVGESKYKRRFSDAQAMCHEYYANLASIRNEYDNTKVQNLCKQLGKGSCWIGLQMDDKANSWEGTKRWIDGHPLGYINWNPGNNNNTIYSYNKVC